MTTPSESGSIATSVSSIEAMLKRFERFDPDTVARQVYEELTATGWNAKLPSSPVGTEPKAAYIRFIYAGSKARVTLYLNTKALISIGAKEQKVAAALLGAEVHKNDIYFYHSDGKIQSALAAAKALHQWADGVSPVTE